MGGLGLFIVLALAVEVLLRTNARKRWKGHAGTIGEDGPVNGLPGRPRGVDGAVADVPLLLELLAAALDAGLPLPWALRLVSDVATPLIREPLAWVVAGLEIGASWDHAWEGLDHLGQLRQIHEALSFAALTGAPAAPLLYAEAAEYRRQAQREAEKRAAALGVKLVVPLGLCSLPAFICLGIVPVVVAMVPAL